MNSLKYNYFWEKMHSLAKRKHFPFRVMFELTYKCNFRCKHCYIPSSYKNGRELETKEVFIILDQLKDIGCYYLGFTGGEPFARKDIIDILWYAKKSGFEIIIYTNGSLIGKDMINDLVRLSPNKIDITIPAMKKEIFESVTGVAGSSNTVFKTIKLLHDRGLNLGFKSCLLKENGKEISKIEKFCHSLSALHRLDDMLYPRLDGSKEPLKYRNESGSRPNSSYVGRVKGATHRNKVGALENGSSLFRCGAGLSQAAITPLGELKMCLMINKPKFNILNSSLVNVWNELRQVMRKIKPEEGYSCSECKLSAICKWCPAHAWLKYGNFSTCDPELRRWAKLKLGDINKR